MVEIKKVEVTFWRKNTKISEFFDNHPHFEITEITNWFLGAFFVIAVIWGLFSIPWNTLLSGNPDVTISIGLPWAFFVIDLMNPEQLPIHFFALLADILIYLILGYLINIIANIIKLSMKNKDKAPAKLYNPNIVFVKKEQPKLQTKNQTSQPIQKQQPQKSTGYANKK